jgi:hypothetical protein
MKLAVLALSLSLSVPALADTVTPILGTLTDSGTVSGTLTVNTSANPAALDYVTGFDVTVYDNGTDYTFDTIHAESIFNGEYYVDSYDSTNDLLRIGFPLSEIGTISTSDPEFCTEDTGCPYMSAFITSPFPVLPGKAVAFDTLGPTPEPSSLILLGTGVLGLAGAARRRFARA